MICFYLLLFFLVLLHCDCYSLEPHIKQKAKYISVDCKDNDNKPVDWWYIYKPHKDIGQYFESGGNFTYITSEELGRLQPSRKFINEYSMLQYTLLPLYKKYAQYSTAVILYRERFYKTLGKIHQASTAFGILITNKFGGIWVTHTIPGFPDLTKSDLPLINTNEFAKGHMITCLSLDLQTMNSLAAAVKHTDSTITMFSLPDKLKLLLPEWARIDIDKNFQGFDESTKSKLIKFETRNKTLEGQIFARGSDDSRCLYKMFAMKQRIVLDVYNSNHKHKMPDCHPEYSLRSINKISIKFPEQQVCYIDKNLDRMSFGVSTNAVWQRNGNKSDDYWMCTGNVAPKGHLSKGGFLTCVSDFFVWFGFDNLKTKEPEC